MLGCWEVLLFRVGGLGGRDVWGFSVEVWDVGMLGCLDVGMFGDFAAQGWGDWEVGKYGVRRSCGGAARITLEVFNHVNPNLICKHL